MQVKAKEVFKQNTDKIGGPGIIVEIDESKFGKRKYNRGHCVEGVWVVGLVERTPKRRILFFPVKNRSKSTLHDIILNHVHPGSIIYTDMWKEYIGLEQYYIHKTVNYSIEFVNSKNGVNINTVEGNWCPLKQAVPKRWRTFQKIWFPLLVYMELRNGSKVSFIKKFI